MVINDLNIGGNPSSPAATDPPLAVHSNATLTLSISGKGLEHVSGRYSQVRQIFRPMNDNELAVRQALNALRESFDEFSPPDSLSVLVRKRLDHSRDVNAGPQTTAHDLRTALWRVLRRLRRSVRFAHQGLLEPDACRHWTNGGDADNSTAILTNWLV